jgi:hypothetical protein
MAQIGAVDFEDPMFILDEEDDVTLAAIDEGIRDAEAGRTLPLEEVQKRLRHSGAPTVDALAACQAAEPAGKRVRRQDCPPHPVRRPTSGRSPGIR